MGKWKYKKSFLDRFNEKWVPDPNTGCWLWTGNSNKKGYGSLRDLERKMWLAHRASWHLFNGPIAKGKGYHGLCVLHKCDTPSCVNPKHLFLGTNQDNINDMINKNRKKIYSKLNRNQILEIRKLSKDNTQAALAKIFNVTQANISCIVLNKTFKTLP